MFADPADESLVELEQSICSVKAISEALLREKKSVAESVRGLKETNRTKVVRQDSSTEEELNNERGSHVDSDDSGLFRNGYFTRRRSVRTKPAKVNTEVNQWKTVAAEKSSKLTSEYNKGLVRKRAEFSIPLGLEMNRNPKNKMTSGSPPESPKKHRKQKLCHESDDEWDVRKNDEFIMEVNRALKRPHNVDKLHKKTLVNEYGRQLSERLSTVNGWSEKLLAPYGTNERRISPESTESRAVQDVDGIYDQLTSMVLKNKISKRTQAALLYKGRDKSTENDGRLIKEWTGDGGERSQQKRRALHDARPSSSKILNEGSDRLSKVEHYLANSTFSGSVTSSDVESIASQEQDIVELSEALLNHPPTRRADNTRTVTKKDGKLLALLVSRLIQKGKLPLIEQMLNSNIDECDLKSSISEIEADRDEVCLKMLIEKYLRKGMRSTLEDKIARTYYKLEARKSQLKNKPDVSDSEELTIRRMTELFKIHGKNTSMNRIVTELVRNYRKHNSGRSDSEIASVRENIENLVIGRFARMYFEGTKGDSGDAERQRIPLPPNSRGVERFSEGASQFQIQWEFPGAPETHNYQGKSSSAREKSAEMIMSTSDNLLSDSSEKLAHEVGAHQVAVRSGRRVSRPCLSVKKTLRTSTSNRFENVEHKKLDEQRRKMRDGNIKWLLEQKQKLLELRKDEARIDRFSHHLPKKLETIVKNQNQVNKLTMN